LCHHLGKRIREALAVPGRPGIRVIAKQFGVSPMTVQNVARQGALPISRRPFATAAPCPNHFGVGSGFIDEDELSCIVSQFDCGNAWLTRVI
jgi:hypothetical protein